MSRKQRLTVTVDPELVEAGNRAVAAGEADSLSGWVSTAMSEKAQRDEKLALLRAARCDDVQGYLMSKPLAPVEFAQWARLNTEPRPET